MNKEKYAAFAQSDAGPDSDVAETYVHALDLLDGILRRIHVFDLPDFWSLESLPMLERLIAYTIHFEQNEAGAFMRPELPPDYGRQCVYSTALKSYQLYLEQIAG